MILKRQLIKPNFDHEKTINGLVAGMDEAGCGPWAGPLVVAAVIFEQLNRQSSNNYVWEIQDSKQLSPIKRETLFENLKNDSSVHIGIGVVNVDEIDDLRLGRALCVGYQRAFHDLCQKTIPQLVLIDGIRDPKLPTKSILLKKGDQISLSIAAASIIAKVTRDGFMQDLHRLFPDYGWDTNQGYGTAKHREAIQKRGLTPFHRLSYKPIQEILKSYPSK